MDLKAYIQLLRTSGAALQAARDQELQSSGHNSGDAILALSQAFLFAIQAQPLTSTSGLVEFQKYMRALKT